MERNFDAVMLDDEMQIYVLADGISTLPAGDRASQIVTGAIIDYYKKINFRHLSEDDIHQVMHRSISIANSEIIKTIQEHPQVSGMGTTLVYCLVIQNHVFICNVGNSRVYLVTENSIILMSKDHTVFQMLHEDKIGPLQVLREVNADRVLTQYIGGYKTPEPFILSSQFPKGGYLIMCTDGLTNLITPEEIHDVVINGFGGMQQKCNLLVEMAIENGGWDNVTVSLIHRRA